MDKSFFQATTKLSDYISHRFYLNVSQSQHNIMKRLEKKIWIIVIHPNDSKVWVKIAAVNNIEYTVRSLKSKPKWVNSSSDTELLNWFCDVETTRTFGKMCDLFFLSFFEVLKILPALQ